MDFILKRASLKQPLLIKIEHPVKRAADSRYKVQIKGVVLEIVVMNIGTTGNRLECELLIYMFFSIKTQRREDEERQSGSLASIES